MAINDKAEEIGGTLAEGTRLIKRVVTERKA
jgi:hypothetical protein